MYRHACVLSLMLLGLAACVSDPGWSGNRARPFDEASKHCEAQVAGIIEPSARETARSECMAAQGWRRPH